MTEPLFPGQTTIIASTSDYFPVDSEIHVKQIQTEIASFQVKVERQGEEPEELFVADVPTRSRQADGALRGEFRNRNTQQMLTAVLTLCPGKGRKYLVGDITLKGGIDEGGTGVWVAEERPKEPPVRYT